MDEKEGAERYEGEMASAEQGGINPITGLPRVFDEQRDMRFARAVEPSRLGDGKQKYYEVPFDKAVDRLAANKAPVSRGHVFVSETPELFERIGFPKLPVMMSQSHVVSCYFGKGEGAKGEHMHNLRGKLKLLPKALKKPMMVIMSESPPNDSVVAIVKMQDAQGYDIIVPVRMSGEAKE